MINDNFLHPSGYLHIFNERSHFALSLLVISILTAMEFTSLWADIEDEVANEVYNEMDS